jgi:hypothetical protein
MSAAGFDSVFQGKAEGAIVYGFKFFLEPV